MFGHKKKPEMYRQGDVLLERCEEPDFETFDRVPLDAGRVVLAYGEVTGHAHAIDVIEKDQAVLFDNGRGVRILKVEKESDLVHEEHAPIRLREGSYRVTRQREWDDKKERYVLD